jgi:anti-sigma factor RsiW
MNHLSDEQLEEIIQGEESPSAHLEDCSECRGRLAEKEALVRRLRSAFVSVKASEELTGRIRKQLNVSSMPAEHTRARRLLSIRFRWRDWSAIAAAAAVLIIVTVFVFQVATPSSAVAAQAALVKIHEHNLSANHEFYSEADPGKLAEYFKNKLGFSPSMPRPGQGLALRGCCVAHFRGQVVGSYVVETPEGVMSIVVVTDQPQSLGMGQKFQQGGYTFWKSSFAKCDMVTARLGGYSYCAVGEISHEYLTDLLSRLMPETQQ